jgi:type IV pilus assembly protein PilO
MPRSFNLPALDMGALTEPKVLVRLALGTLFVANLVAAGFAFHWFDASPDAVNQQLLAAQAQHLTENARLMKTRALAKNIARGKEQGEQFVATSMTSRRRTYSTIIGEITETAKTAGMTKAGGTISLEPIAGSDDLDLMSIVFTFEGGYAELLKFVNLLDRSPRFLIIETLTVTPRAQSNVLTVGVKLNTFVREEDSHQGIDPAKVEPVKAGAM